MTAGIAVLLSLVAVGLVPLAFINKEDISELTTTVDALKRDQDNMRQLSTNVDALKRDQDDMRQLSTTVDALKRDQNHMSTTVDALKRDQNHTSTTLDALKLDQDAMRQLSTTVDALKRDEDAMRQLSSTVDALKRGLEKERNRTAALEQRLHEMSMTPVPCPIGYTLSRGICYKAFNTKKTFSEAAAFCREDGGTLAMPRDAETNAFLTPLHKTVYENYAFWFGLHDRCEEGSFEWVDGSALGSYNDWAKGEPNDYGGGEDCVLYSGVPWKGKWFDGNCDWTMRFICQAVTGRP